MPIPAGLGYQPPANPDDLSDASAALPVPTGLGEQVIAEGARMTPQLGNFLRGRPEDIANAFGGTGSKVSLDDSDRLSSDQANAKYGIPGQLRFNTDIDDADAAFQSAQARQRAFRNEVLSRSTVNPLQAIGAGLYGSLTDPAGVALMLGTDGIASYVKGLGAGVEGAAQAASAISKIGRVGNLAVDVAKTAGEGALINAPYVGVQAGLNAWSGDPETLGDGLRDLAAGAILHTGIHYAGDIAGAVADAAKRAIGADTAIPDPTAPKPYMPADVQDLPEVSRAGAFAKALDDVAGDEPVDVGQYVARERDADLGALAQLDETNATPQIAMRPLDAATAVTTAGTEVPVRYGLAELGDLTTSHTNDLEPNPDFPPELQPRDRSRLGSMARNYALERDLNPKLLISDVSAAGGAPIVGPDGVVESGNGRTIALRRSAQMGNSPYGGQAYAKYRAELEAQGYDTSGMTNPVLVRMRTEPMSGAARAALTREMNSDVTERMSPVEQGMQDAKRLSDQALSSVDVRRPLADRDFVRDFLGRVAPDQVNTLTTADGALSPQGAQRINAALIARAYGDPRIVGQLFEGEESPIRKIGEALADAAPAWAQMRALASSGAIPADLDLTDNLSSALDLVRHARTEKIDLGQLLTERLGQTELFGGAAVAPETEALLRMMFRDEAMKKPTPPEKLSAALKDYARQAVAVTPGPDLFGETAGEDTARQILDTLSDRFARHDPGDIDLRAPGKALDANAASGGGEASRAPVLDLRDPGLERAPERSGGEPGARQAGGGDGGAGDPGEAQPRQTADSLIAADPELRALQADTERLMQAHGLEDDETPATQEPKTLAEAIRAAAVCLIGELG